PSHLTDLMEQIRTEQHTIGLFEEHAGVPSVWKVRRRHPAESMPPSLDYVGASQPARGPRPQVFEFPPRPNLPAGRLRLWSDREPVVQGAAFVHFEVAPADPTQ